MTGFLNLLSVRYTKSMRSPYRLLGVTLLPLIRWRISKVTGLEHLPSVGPFIVAANHQSWMDSVVVAGAMYNHIPSSLRFIAQSSKYRFLGGIPINEYDKGRVIDVAYGYLEAGHPVIIFPEGNSNKNPELRTGKTGAARLALRSGLPVIPIGIQGTEGVKGWQALGWFLKFWKPCQVMIGRPLVFPKTDLATVDHDRLMTVTYQIMERISHYSGKPYTLSADTALQEKTVGWLRRFSRTAVVPWFGRRLRLDGLDYLPATGPFIIAANHVSYFDPLAMSTALLKTRKIQPFFLTKSTIAAAWKRILGSGAHDALGMLPIDNQEKSRVLDAAIRHLHAGGVIGIFPEGTRNKPTINPKWQTTMLKSKTGLARLVVATRVPVIPAGIKAPAGIGIWQMIGNIFRWWRPITITFGPPVNFGLLPTGQPTKDQLETLTRTAMKRISQLSGLAYPY